METKLTSDDTAAICRHMNEDHADAVAAYARVYGKIAQAVSAEMIAMDGEAMELGIETGDGRVVARIPFDHRLTDTADARETLIKMARQAALEA
jgi:putative heme iron utilization protein